MSTNMYDLMIWNQLSFTEKLYRLRKGKACVRPEDEEQSAERPHLGLLGSTQPAERLNRPLIRPLSLEPLHESNGHLPPANGHLPPANGHLPPPPANWLAMWGVSHYIDAMPVALAVEAWISANDCCTRGASRVWPGFYFLKVFSLYIGSWYGDGFWSVSVVESWRT